LPYYSMLTEDTGWGWGVVDGHKGGMLRGLWNHRNVNLLQATNICTIPYIILYDALDTS
jgi:hypothetical protein